MAKRYALPAQSWGAAISNGHPKKLVQLLDYHERAAAAIRLVLGMLDEQAIGSSTKRAATTITNAMAIDDARRATSTRGRPQGSVTRSKPGAWAAKKRAQRHATAARLAHFDRDQSRPAPDGPKSIGVLVQHGYLKLKGDGYVRTAKEFTP